MGGRIFVVDDDEELCDLMAQTLKRRGHDVSFCLKAEEGLEKILADPPDVILLDLEVPSMGGFQLCQKLRSDPRAQKVPILFVTSSDSDFDKWQAKSLGASGYINKPFRASVLIKEVEDRLPMQVAAAASPPAAPPAPVVQPPQPTPVPAVFPPKQELPRPAPLPIPPVPVPAALPRASQTKRVLVVDDDMELCQVIVDTLKENTYEASFVQTAEEALEKILKDKPDVILLDLEIPQMGGYALCGKLRADKATKDVPVVFLTVRDSDVDRRAAMSLGADLYITKPFRRSHLLKEVGDLLAARADPAAWAARQAQVASAAALPTVTGKPGSIPAIKLSVPRSGLPSGGTRGWFAGHKKTVAGIGAILLIALTWGGFFVYKKFTARVLADGQAEEGGGTISVNVMQVAPAPFQDLMVAVGTIVGGSEVELRFQTEGKIKSLNFNEGASVKAGQVIAQLDQTQALIKMERAKSEYFRYEKLYALGGVSRDRLDEARVQYEYAQSEMEKTVLKVSKDGIFGDKGVEVGEFVTPQKKVGTIVNLDTVLVRIGVIEKEIDKIYPGQPVIATVDTYPGMEFKGKVENISPLVQGQSKTLSVEARIPNEGKLLLPGMFARSKIVVYEKESVLSVPNDALEKTEEGYRCFVVGEGSKAEVRKVEAAYISLTHTVISNGLNPGDRVIVQKPQELKAGSPLKVMDVEKGGGGAQVETGAAGHGGSAGENP